MFGLGGVISNPSLASRAPGIGAPAMTNSSAFMSKKNIVPRSSKYEELLPGKCEPGIFTRKRDDDRRSRVSVVSRPISITTRDCSRDRVANNYVHIIVSGHKFTTFKDTLRRFPESRLGDEGEREMYYDRLRKAYVFHNRCRQSFESILYFYQSNGHLVQPVNVGQEVFMKEVMFFKLPIHDDLDNAAIDLGYDTVQNLSAVPRKLQKLMEEERSLCMKVLAVFDNLTTLVYVFTQLIITVPHFHRSKSHHIKVLQSVVFWVELSCIVWFVLLYTLRLFMSKNRKAFVAKFLNMIDVLVVVSYLINQARSNKDHCVTRRKDDDFKLCIFMSAVVTMVSLLRLFSFARYSELLYCLGIALKRSFADLAQVLLMIVLLTYMFACLAYFLETDETDGPQTFKSVFDALYWGTITISTVGYGDIAPVTTAGKFVGATLALLGLPLIAIPMPLIMSKFDSYYQNVKQRRKTNEMSAKLMKEAERMSAGDQQNDQLPDHAADECEDRKNLSWMVKARDAYGNCRIPDDDEDSSSQQGSKTPRRRRSGASNLITNSDSPGRGDELPTSVLAQWR
ncbi:potassium voltage-gated channel subfamily A member 6-like [Bolinopsis microptera]|uniref:potassium voltage-gated channel subfamily A member 6-like n=1 Tax=Bolinopsis microptera TaxID=2820187 RepID=UPI003078BAF0